MSLWVSPNSPTHRPSYARSHSSSHSNHRSEVHRSSDHRSADNKPQYYWTRPSSSSKSHQSHSHHSSSRARPRSGYFHSVLHKIKRYLRRLYDYARRHPMKLFLLVIMPLITGGALADLLKRFGIRLPRTLEKAIPGMSGRRGMYGGSGDGDSIQGVLKLAKMFI